MVSLKLVSMALKGFAYVNDREIGEDAKSGGGGSGDAGGGGDGSGVSGGCDDGVGCGGVGGGGDGGFSSVNDRDRRRHGSGLGEGGWWR